jgi:hypothetical protein
VRDNGRGGIPHVAAHRADKVTQHGA